MTTRDLPDCFTERPTPLLSIMGEALMRNHWKSLNAEMINEWNEVGSKLRRTELTLSSKLGVRKYDVKTVMTTATENDGVYKLELSFNTERELPPGEKGRVRALAEAAKISLAVYKKCKGCITYKAKQIDVEFGSEKSGFHRMADREGIEQFLSIGDLNALSKQKNMTISVEGKMGKVNYLTSNLPIKKLLNKVGVKIKEMSREMMSWTVDQANQYNLDFMNTSVDWEYESSTVLVGNIPLDVVLKTMTADVMAKINRSIQLSFPSARLTKETVDRLMSGNKYWIAPGDIGASGFNGGKVSILVDLEKPVRVGIGLNGGTPILARPKVDNTYGEYYLRQFLNDEEARFLRLLSPNSGNYMLAAFRQMNTVPEAQDLTRRCIKQCLAETIGTDVYVFPISGKHLWGQEDDYKEETILIAMSQVEDGGKLLSEIMEIPQENPVFRMRFGSLEVQGYTTMATI